MKKKQGVKRKVGSYIEDRHSQQDSQVPPMMAVLDVEVREQQLVRGPRRAELAAAA